MFLFAGHSNLEINHQNQSQFLLRKQAPEVPCKNRGSQEFRKFQRQTPSLESLLNKVPGLKACNFIEKKLQHRCFPMKFAKFLRTTILKNICERLLFLLHANLYKFLLKNLLTKTTCKCHYPVKIQ